MQIDELFRKKFENEVFERTGKKVRNCFFLVRGTNGKEYYVFQGNNKQLIALMEVDFSGNFRFI